MMTMKKIRSQDFDKMLLDSHKVSAVRNNYFGAPVNRKTKSAIPIGDVKINKILISEEFP